MREEQKTQDAITGDMLMLTRSLKEQTAAFHALVRNDVETLTKSTQLAEQHQRQLGVQTLKLRQRSGFCGRCWIWLIILLICVLFIGNPLLHQTLKSEGPLLIAFSLLDSCGNKSFHQESVLRLNTWSDYDILRK